jgi:hypothetical protein
LLKILSIIKGNAFLSSGNHLFKRACCVTIAEVANVTGCLIIVHGISKHLTKGTKSKTGAAFNFSINNLPLQS